MFSTIESFISIDDELSALSVDFATFVGDGSAPGVDLPGVDPMASADPMGITGGTAPVVVPVDLPALPSLDGLFQIDGDGFDLDLTILDVGRGFDQSGFNDLL